MALITSARVLNSALVTRPSTFGSCWVTTSKRVHEGHIWNVNDNIVGGLLRRGESGLPLLRKDELFFFDLLTEDGTRDLSERHRDRERKERKIRSLVAEMISFPQTASDDDAPERSGSFVCREKQETKDFYMEKGFSSDRDVPEKPRGERISTIFRSLLIA
ncbi:hypothetical protein ACLOJK_022832 [Asimina triloba]